MTGFIQLHKKILDWEWYNDIKVFRLFLHILIKANYDDKSYNKILIKRGQHLTSLSSLAKETGLSIQEVRTCLSKLINSNAITNKSTKLYRLLTIVKYEEYQSVDESATKLATKQQQRNQQSQQQSEEVESPTLSAMVATKPATKLATTPIGYGYTNNQPTKVTKRDACEKKKEVGLVDFNNFNILDLITEKTKTQVKGIVEKKKWKFEVFVESYNEKKKSDQDAPSSWDGAFKGFAEHSPIFDPKKQKKKPKPTGENLTANFGPIQKEIHDAGQANFNLKINNLSCKKSPTENEKTLSDFESKYGLKVDWISYMDFKTKHPDIDPKTIDNRTQSAVGEQNAA